ncbi:MAG: transcriptional regulator [Geobacteraceae bacterium GWC2_58_44]|nr:MAG: transcriptional regulator [Geobacteraceae bacterium GWC2_58_44]HBG06242.1 MarR family transcriptional regulator [Geobacter sp.]
MLKVTITTGSVEEFFARGKTLARKIDIGETIEPSTFIMFEDPEDILEIVTKARISLFRAVKKEPGSITDIALRLHRDRSAVKRDVDVLVGAGLIQIYDVPHHGHGRKKYLKAAAEEFQLLAQVG